MCNTKLAFVRLLKWTPRVLNAKDVADMLGIARMFTAKEEKSRQTYYRKVFLTIAFLLNHNFPL